MEAYRESLFLIDKWLEVMSTLYFRPDSRWSTINSARIPFTRPRT